MNYLGRTLLIGVEPAGKYAQQLKRWLVERTQVVLAKRGKGRNCQTPYFKIESNGCWVWQRRTNASGYGSIGMGQGKQRKEPYQHRYFYEQFVGPIPEGMTVDHTCVNSLCGNPEHLELVSHSDNLKRAWKRNPDRFSRQKKISV